MLWKTSGLGEGYSSPVIVQGRLYTQGQSGDHQYVLAFDAATGKKLWETPTTAAFHHRQAGNGPRGTPTIESGRVYAEAADGMLVCLDAATGKVIWSQNVVRKYGGSQIMWGIGESPLVDGDRLIMMPGGPGAAVVSLNKLNGSLQWKTGSDEAGYAAALVVDIGGMRQVLALTGQSLLGIKEDSGEMLWRYPKIITRWPGMATPIYHDGYLFVSTAFDADCALLKLGPRTMSEVYFKHAGMSYFYYWTSVLIGDTLYGYSNSVLTAMDFKTGKVLWKERSVGKGSVLYADQRLYVLSEEGVMGLAEVTPQRYKEISRFEVPIAQAPARTPPVISDGKLYLRVQDNLLCYDIKAR
jgi:outer membrane protein assembly factor BamB